VWGRKQLHLGISRVVEDQAGGLGVGLSACGVWRVGGRQWVPNEQELMGDVCVVFGW